MINVSGHIFVNQIFCDKIQIRIDFFLSHLNATGIDNILFLSNSHSPSKL